MLSSLLFALTFVFAVEFNADSLTSVQNSTKVIVKGLLDYYPLASSDASTRSGWAPGMFQQPYYWWEAGVAWGVMVDWQFFTGQADYNDLIKTALSFQAGDSGDYMPQNQSLTEGNDDQGFWGLAVMTAAERNFSNPSSDQHGWLYGAQAVYNDMKSRWETTKCGGGLRWQIYTWNSGYNYKNSVSNGCLFNLAARLAHYTGNDTYAKFAEEVYQWFVDVKFLDTSGDAWPVYDGASMDTNCTSLTEIEWTYNAGLLLSGSAYMHDFHNSSGNWGDRSKRIWNHASKKFFDNNVVFEQACQPSGRCNNDQRSFKGIFMQQLGQTASLLPDLQDEIMTAINASAAAAAGSCSGGRDGHTCGLNWLGKSYDNMYGLGEQISALAALSNTQVLSRHKPFTASTGGSSNGSVNAGLSAGKANKRNPLDDNRPVSTADRAGAGIITAVLMVFLIGVGIWIII